MSTLSTTQRALRDITSELVVRVRQHRAMQANYLESAQAERAAGDELDSRIAILRDLLR